MEIRCPLVGSDHHPEASDMLLMLPMGTLIELRREPTNEHDRRAVACYYDGVKLGYIPMNHNTPVAAAMDATPLVDVTAELVAPGEWVTNATTGKRRFDAPRILVRAVG